MPQDTISYSASDSEAQLDADPQRTQSIIRLVAWLATGIVGFVQAWAFRFAIISDGNSYLDVATNYLRGDYNQAINAYWSPMVSWLLAVLMKIFHFSGRWDTTVFHLLNFAGLLIALRSFEFFFRIFLTFLGHTGDAPKDSLLQEAHWWLLGYGLFFSTMLYVLTMEPVTPDVWVCVVSYLAVGLLLRIAQRPEGWRDFALLGLIMGLAYLTKSFYFPFSFVFLACAFWVGGQFRQSATRTAVALIVFALVSCPFVAVLSRAKQRFTFGDVGKIAYAMCINPIDQIAFWQGENHSGIPKHPTREVLSAPRVFEFAGPVSGSYPPFYDLSYWADGVQSHFNIGGQLRILRQSVGTFYAILLVQSEFAVGLLVIFVLRAQFREILSALARIWLLWVAPCAACIAYALVLTENRYVAPFIVFIWLALFAAAVSASSGISKRIVHAVVLAALLFTGAKTAKSFASDLLTMRGMRNVHWDVAQSLAGIGLKPGDRLAVIATAGQNHWARLANVKVAAELPLGQEGLFWEGDQATQDRVFDAFRKTGSVAVLVKNPPLGCIRQGWTQLGDTPYYLHSLTPAP